jgi:hypothetical protein
MHSSSRDLLTWALVPRSDDLETLPLTWKFEDNPGSQSGILFQTVPILLNQSQKCRSAFNSWCKSVGKCRKVYAGLRIFAIWQKNHIFRHSVYYSVVLPLLRVRARESAPSLIGINGMSHLSGRIGLGLCEDDSWLNLHMRTEQIHEREIVSWQ